MLWGYGHFKESVLYSLRSKHFRGAKNGVFGILPVLSPFFAQPKLVRSLISMDFPFPKNAQEHLVRRLVLYGLKVHLPTSTKLYSERLGLT